MYSFEVEDQRFCLGWNALDMMDQRLSEARKVSVDTTLPRSMTVARVHVREWASSPM